jgi:hypothetical protein
VERQYLFSFSGLVSLVLFALLLPGHAAAVGQEIIVSGGKHPGYTFVVLTSNAGGGTCAVTLYDGPDEEISIPNNIIGRVSGEDTEGIYNVTAISGGAFKDKTSITKVSTGNVSVINPDAFHGCVNLKHAYLDNVVTIEERAFKDCKKLESVIISRVEKIGKSAFENCEGLKRLFVTKYAPISVNPGADAFANVYEGLNIVILDLFIDENVDDYKTECLATGAWKPLFEAGGALAKAKFVDIRTKTPPMPKGISYQSGDGKTYYAEKQGGLYVITVPEGAYQYYPGRHDGSYLPYRIDLEAIRKHLRFIGIETEGNDANAIVSPRPGTEECEFRCEVKISDESRNYVPVTFTFTRVDEQGIWPPCTSVIRLVIKEAGYGGAAKDAVAVEDACLPKNVVITYEGKKYTSDPVPEIEEVGEKRIPYTTITLPLSSADLDAAINDKALELSFKLPLNVTVDGFKDYTYDPDTRVLSGSFNGIKVELPETEKNKAEYAQTFTLRALGWIEQEIRIYVRASISVVEPEGNFLEPDLKNYKLEYTLSPDGSVVKARLYMFHKAPPDKDTPVVVALVDARIRTAEGDYLDFADLFYQCGDPEWPLQIIFPTVIRKVSNVDDLLSDGDTVIHKVSNAGGLLSDGDVLTVKDLLGYRLEEVTYLLDDGRICTQTYDGTSGSFGNIAEDNRIVQPLQPLPDSGGNDDNNNNNNNNNNDRGGSEGEGGGGCTAGFGAGALPLAAGVMAMRRRGRTSRIKRVFSLLLPLVLFALILLSPATGRAAERVTEPLKNNFAFWSPPDDELTPQDTYQLEYRYTGAGNGRNSWAVTGYKRNPNAESGEIHVDIPRTMRSPDGGPELQVTQIGGLPDRAYQGRFYHPFEDTEAVKTDIISVNAPGVSFIYNQAFRNCKSLEYASFPAVTDIGEQAFYNTSLTRLDIRSIEKFTVREGEWGLVSPFQNTSVGEFTLPDNPANTVDWRAFFHPHVNWTVPLIIVTKNGDLSPYVRLWKDAERNGILLNIRDIVKAIKPTEIMRIYSTVTEKGKKGIAREAKFLEADPLNPNGRGTHNIILPYGTFGTSTLTIELPLWSEKPLPVVTPDPADHKLGELKTYTVMWNGEPAVSVDVRVSEEEPLNLPQSVYIIRKDARIFAEQDKADAWSYKITLPYSDLTALNLAFVPSSEATFTSVAPPMNYDPVEKAYTGFIDFSDGVDSWTPRKDPLLFTFNSVPPVTVKVKVEEIAKEQRVLFESNPTADGCKITYETVTEKGEKRFRVHLYLPYASEVSAENRIIPDRNARQGRYFQPAEVSAENRIISDLLPVIVYKTGEKFNLGKFDVVWGKSGMEIIFMVADLKVLNQLKLSSLTWNESGEKDAFVQNFDGVEFDFAVVDQEPSGPAADEDDEGGEDDKGGEGGGGDNGGGGSGGGGGGCTAGFGAVVLLAAVGIAAMRKR